MIASRRELAARRHFERHLREQGHSRTWAAKAATAASVAECLRALPLWRRLQVLLGRLP